MDIKPKVYIPQEQTRWDEKAQAAISIMDFTPALRYGELVVCLAPNISFHYTATVIQALRERMAEFRPDDYLIAVGAPLVIALSAKIAMDRTGGVLNLLSWDRREREYLNTRIEM